MCRAESIVSSNFIISMDEEDWLGTGVYFFLDGISSGVECAIEWARNSHKGQSCCVIEVTIAIPKKLIFDLTSIVGLHHYDIIRKNIIYENYNFLSSRRDLSIKKRRDIRLDDKIITNSVMKKVNKKLLIHNVYIKNFKQRKLILESSYPNSTVACLNDLSLITEMKIMIL